MPRFYVLLFIITAIHVTFVIQSVKREIYNDINNNSSVQTYVLNISKLLHKTNKLFLSFSIDSREIRNGLHNPSLRNSELIRLTSYLSPGYLRIGGTEADRLVFEEENSVLASELKLNPNDTFIMSGRKWTELHTFVEKSGFRVIFDLNVLLRNGSNWHTSNAKSLLDFSASKSYRVDWQLGNEPNAFLHTFNATVSPSQLAEDFTALRRLLNTYPEYYKALVVGPDVTSPHRRGVSMPAERFLQEFVNPKKGKPPVDAVAWHHYYLHRNATASDFLAPAVLDSLDTIIDLVKEAVKNSGKSLWITESGSASGGGVAGVSDRFVSSFSLLDRLGLAARRGVDLVVRQSLYAGRYALIHRTTLRPNPDWWVSYVYKRLVAPTVLSIEAKSEVKETLRVYAHCSQNGSVVVFGVNLSDAPEQLMVETADRRAATCTSAQLYQLTAPHLLSQKVMLNGDLLTVPSDSPPALHSVTVDTLKPLALAGHSIFYLDFNNLQPYLCQSDVQ